MPAWRANDSRFFLATPKTAGHLETRAIKVFIYEKARTGLYFWWRGNDFSID